MFGNAIAPVAENRLPEFLDLEYIRYRLNQVFLNLKQFKRFEVLVMTLIRWEPLREMDSLQREMNRLFDSLTPATDRADRGVAFVPAAEMEETADAINLKLEIPGLEAKDLDVQVTAEAVAISGERRSETKSEEKGMTRSEFRYGSFRRVIPLPARVQNDSVQAEYKNGVLHLNLPKAEAEKNRVVKVQIGGQ
jgi:HSP20 family protein